MDRILFQEKNHIYTQESTGLRLMPVSNVYKIFSPTFNEDHNTKKKALQEVLGAKLYKELKTKWEAKKGHILQPEYITYLEKRVPNWETYIYMIDKVKQDWADARDTGASKGTAYHAGKEEADIKRGFSINCMNGLEYPTQPHGKDGDNNSSVTECICDLPPGYYPELLVWYLFPTPVFSKSLECEIAGIAGQIDRAFLEVTCSFIEDYKSNKSLSDYPLEIKNYGFEYHSGPWAKMKSTRMSKYKIQLPLYGWILEQHGLPPEALNIIHKDKPIRIAYDSGK